MVAVARDGIHPGAAAMSSTTSKYGPTCRQCARPTTGARALQRVEELEDEAILTHHRCARCSRSAVCGFGCDRGGLQFHGYDGLRHRIERVVTLSRGPVHGPRGPGDAHYARLHQDRVVPGRERLLDGS